MKELQENARRAVTRGKPTSGRTLSTATDLDDLHAARVVEPTSESADDGVMHGRGVARPGGGPSVPPDQREPERLDFLSSQVEPLPLSSNARTRLGDMTGGRAHIMRIGP